MADDSSKKREDTRLAHSGLNPHDNFGIVNPPVYHASTVTFPTVDAMNAASRNPLEGVYYGRFGTPTTFAFEAAMADLEGAEKALALPSGLAAISFTIMTFVGQGDHLLMTDSVYGPTRKFCDGLLAKYGVETTYYDPMIGAGISDLIRPNTKVVFVEAPGSLTFEVQDVPAIAKAAHAAGDVKVILDNTWSAGIYFKPFEHDIDVSVQATTKYVAGHSDTMLGTATGNAADIKRIRLTALGLGSSVSPDDCYLALRGLRSVKARLAQHQEKGMAVARWLADRPEVSRVLHPAFADCPGHENWKRDFTGACGLFAVELNGVSDTAIAAMLDGYELFAMGYSWGGFESLVIPVHLKGVRTATGWSGGPVLRFHIGLEDADDLIDDLAAGFTRLSGA